MNLVRRLLLAGGDGQFNGPHEPCRGLASDSVCGWAQDPIHRQHLRVPAIWRVRHVLSPPPGYVEKIHNGLWCPAVEMQVYGVDLRRNGRAFPARKHQPQSPIGLGESSGILEVPQRIGSVLECVAREYDIELLGWHVGQIFNRSQPHAPGTSAIDCPIPHPKSKTRGEGGRSRK